MPCTEFSDEWRAFTALKTNFPTINSWTTQSSLWGGVWVVIAISSNYTGIRSHILGTLRNDDGREDENEKMNFFSRRQHCTLLHKNYLTIFAQNADGSILKI